MGIEVSPLNLRVFSIAVGVALVHLFAGIVIFLNVDSVLHTTPLALMSLLSVGNGQIVGLALISTALLALYPFIVHRITRIGFILCIAPQQVLLLAHFVSAAIAIATGHYPDGYVPVGGSWFIAVDQSWLIMISLWHTYEYHKV